MTVLMLSILLSFSPVKGDTGLGLIAGSRTGVSFKHFTSVTNAFDAAVAWSFSDDWVSLHSDYLWHSFGDINVEKGRMPWYYGIGAWIAFDDQNSAGIRVPLGLEYLFAGSDIDLFLEAAAGLEVIPDTDFRMDAGFGIRFFF
ncbi:hypothetical protein CSA37_05220 [Candidatus Fermentibacteria bacterium]|nr:MAG: hypothetical protein CSA37_05220 [Candidatus Fermentibacteria bacterium]